MLSVGCACQDSLLKEACDLGAGFTKYNKVWSQDEGGDWTYSWGQKSMERFLGRIGQKVNSLLALQVYTLTFEGCGFATTWGPTPSLNFSMAQLIHHWCNTHCTPFPSTANHGCRLIQTRVRMKKRARGGREGVGTGGRNGGRRRGEGKGGREK